VPLIRKPARGFRNRLFRGVTAGQLTFETGTPMSNRGRNKDFAAPMQIKITGKNLDAGDAFRDHVEDRLHQLQQRYFEGTVHAHVTVERQRSGFHTDCTLHLATGLVLQAHGQAGDAHPSFDFAAQHLEKQLKRYKQRIKDHHKTRREPVRRENAASYIISTAADSDSEPADLNPVVIAEQATSVPELTVGEAVMQLDISSVPFVLFRNSGHGALNVVYRRSDGNIGWVDPRPQPN
jgi:ribosomal subunit interface protein